MEFFGGIFVVIALVAGAVFLQILLSRKRNKLPGLILPIASFGVSIAAVIIVVSIALSPASPAEAAAATMEDGEIAGEEVPLMDQPEETSSLAAAIAATFLLYNIPTAALLAIYAFFRLMRKRPRIAHAAPTPRPSRSAGPEYTSKKIKL